MTEKKPAHQKPLPGELVEAIELNNIEEVERLLECGADPNEVDGEGKSALILAIGNWCRIAARQLVEKGADVDKKGPKGRTPLMTAAFYWDTLDMARVLVGNNADINATDEDGKTALILACERENGQIARLLIEHNADTTICDRQGGTVLTVVNRLRNEEFTRTVEETYERQRREHRVAEAAALAARRQHLLRGIAHKPAFIRRPCP